LAILLLPSSRQFPSCSDWNFIQEARIIFSSLAKDRKQAPAAERHESHSRLCPQRESKMRRQPPPPQSDKRRSVDDDFQLLMDMSRRAINESKAVIERSRDLMSRLDRLTTPEQTTPEQKDPSDSPPTRTR